MKWNYQNEVLCLPGAVLSASGADAVQLRVLLWLASDLSLAEKPRQLAKLAECDLKSAQAALKYWTDLGIVLPEGAQLEAAVEVMAQVQETVAAEPKRKLLQRADALPTYTSTEVAELLESRASVRALVDEAQNIIGKIFNPSEINILVGMLDYLGVCEEGVLMILAHCKRIGKVNLRSIEKYAFSLVDRGIVEPAALEEEFKLLEMLHSFEGEVRKMFGMKSRALTAKENKMLRAWVSYGYGIDVVQKAYEMTVNAINEPSLPYANSILERWNSEGYRTLAEIEAAENAAKQEKEGATTLGKSFDADDLFEAALKRTFRELDTGD